MGDFSCYVTIINQTSSPFTLTTANCSVGYWAVNPPPQIPANGQVSFQTKDEWGPYGSEGWCSYKMTRTGVTASFHFSDPTTSSNIFTASSSNNSVLSISQQGFSSTGHPLRVYAYLTNSAFKQKGAKGLVSAEAMKAIEDDTPEAYDKLATELTAIKYSKGKTIIEDE